MSARGLLIDIQQAAGVRADAMPQARRLRALVVAALAQVQAEAGELTIRVVSAAESAQLNGDYRGKPNPTNVLSFSYGVPGVLGDLAICAEVIAAEAREQGKPEADHWCHMVVHGVMHLCGLDHQIDDDAATMEALETRVLAEFGIPDPYQHQTTQTAAA